ncbi:MAG: ABC transporter ATP-binding protein [Candidatus Cloacimonadota bacterium]|nr:ABC transporter ATP-binding protein [Candidatus Cloacimonadota bacterium]
MIRIANVSKNYGNIRALQNISLQINEGEIFGLLGPNGAGKTTLINLLNTLLNFDKGNIEIQGKNISENSEEIKKILGVIPQEISLYNDLTAEYNLHFWGKMYGLKKPLLMKKADEYLKLVGLYDRRKSAVSTFSGGMKRRLNIAASLLHDPQILLMDEPTVGVDPQSRNYIFELIEKLHENGKTIVYTTHYMEEAERLCNRIAIIDHGKVIALGTKNELYAILENENAIEFTFQNTFQENEFPPLPQNFSYQIIADKSIRISGKNILKNIPLLIKNVDNYKNGYVDIRISKPNLENVFLRLTGRELRE